METSKTLSLPLKAYVTSQSLSWTGETRLFHLLRGILQVLVELGIFLCVVGGRGSFRIHQSPHWTPKQITMTFLKYCPF